MRKLLALVLLVVLTLSIPGVAQNATAGHSGRPQIARKVLGGLVRLVRARPIRSRLFRGGCSG